jgi:hypothetical protein
MSEISTSVKHFLENYDHLALRSIYFTNIAYTSQMTVEIDGFFRVSQKSSVLANGSMGKEK